MCALSGRLLFLLINGTNIKTLGLNSADKMLARESREQRKPVATDAELATHARTGGDRRAI
jgi:hypothetical protein